MKEAIKTKSVGKNFVKTNGVLLKQTSDTALAFFPDIHPGGVRGNLVRFKKNRADKWEKIPEEDFRKLSLYEGVHIELGTKQLETLIQEVNKRKKIIANVGVLSGEHEYVVADPTTVLRVDDTNVKNILQQILDSGFSEDFWNLISASSPHLADKLSAGHLQLQREAIIDELQARLGQNFPETKGDSSWQKWIYKNSWLFGVNYRKPIEKKKINMQGIMPDYLFPTVDGFVDILEIKLPTADVIKEDKSHHGSWVWSKEANFAIGQVVNYLAEIDRQRLELERALDNDCLLVKPRAYILIGQSDDWENSKKEGLRNLNHSLHGIEVLTYSDLIQRGKTFLISVDASNE